MERSDFFIGSMTCIYISSEYDAMDATNTALMIYTIFQLEENDPLLSESEILERMTELIKNSIEFSDYYQLINHPPKLDRHGRKKRAIPPPRHHDRIIVALVCLDLMKYLNLMTDLNKFDLIFEHFCLYHQYPLDIFILDAIRSSNFYVEQKKRISNLLIRKIIQRRREDQIDEHSHEQEPRREDSL